MRTRTRRTLQHRLAACLLPLLAAACGHQEPATRLLLTQRDDGSATITVRGKDGLQVAVVANRAWRGADAVHAGLFGQRCPSQIEPELARQGAGTLLLGVLVGGELSGPIPAAWLAAIQEPLVLQAVTSEAIDGKTSLALSDALLLTRDPEKRVIAPFPIDQQLLAAALPFALFVVLPLAMAAAIFRVRSPRIQTLARGALVAAIAIVAALRWSERDSVPLMPQAAGDPLVALERSYGAGLRDLVGALRTHRAANQTLAIAIDPAIRSEQQSLATHLQFLLGDTTVTATPTGLTDGSLCIDLAAGTRAATEPVPGGELLLRTPIAELRRVGAR